MSETTTTKKSTFAEALGREILVFDGPMGTELYRHHVFTNRCFDELSLSDPKLIARIHGDYREAGADVLTTNTFGANRHLLRKFGLDDRQTEILRAGATLARESADAADRTMYVAGSIGPLPGGLQFEEEIESMVLEMVDPLMDSGADFILFETQPSREAMELCAAAMTRRPDVPFVLSCAIVHDGRSLVGEPVSRLLAPLPSAFAQPIAWGLNCGTGPDGLLEAVEEAVRMTELPLIVQPNAGTPREVEGRSIYYCSPEYLTTYAQRFVELGVAAVGGCCGTMPEHIHNIARSIKRITRSKKTEPILKPADEQVEERKPIPFADRSRFAWKLSRGKWVTSVELVPPRGYDLTKVIKKCRTLYRHGVDAINIPDGPRASSRISPMVVADRIQREAKIESILHFCCRDRNLIGMQADMLACAAQEIRNILFVTGDPPKLGNYPEATGVFDTDAIGICALQRRLNHGIDLGGQEIRPATAAVVGVGLDPTALDREKELDRFHQKVEAGAEFAITQPVFDPEALLSFLEAIGEQKIPIVAGVWPLASYRNALFMQNEVPGVEIPESTMQRMETAESKEAQMAVGIQIARESVEAVRDQIAGIQVSAPFGRIDIALSVIEGWDEK